MGVYIGWVARQGSFSESMPLRNEQGDITLVFSGEDYPEPGTAQDFANAVTTSRWMVRHTSFTSMRRTRFLSRLNGMFHGWL